MQLFSQFNELNAPTGINPDDSLYAVLPIANQDGYFIGKDNDNLACLLISTIDSLVANHPPIRLENLDVQFGLPCSMEMQAEKLEGMFTILRCRSQEQEILTSFFSVCQSIIRMLGENPSQDNIAKAVNKFVRIFSKLLEPQNRTVNGLFGELFLISISSDPIFALDVWRSEDNARFDFSYEEVYLEVKTTAGRKRSHKFTYDQCNPPDNSSAIVASMFVEQSTGGTSLRDLFDEVEAIAYSNPNLVIKLHEVISDTLGKTFNDAMKIAFDVHQTKTSLKFYDLREIPAIRHTLTNELSEVSFRSSLSEESYLSLAELSSKFPKFSPLLPIA